MAIVCLQWWIYYATNDKEHQPSSQGCAPSVLITFINMVLFKNADALPGCDTVYMFKGQNELQMFLIIVSVLCVPVMLFVKPLVLRKRHAAAKSAGNRMDVNGGQANNQAAHGDSHGEDEPFNFGETMILQGIHTIEYVLGSVSHTASYLRLWALSLAHAQLSEVLWNMVMRIGLGFDSW